MKPAVRGFASAAGMVRVTATIQSARSTLEIQTFWPLIRKSSPSRRALVLISIALEPASGSVRREAELDLAGREAGQDLLLLLLGAVPGQGGRAEAGVEHVEERPAVPPDAHSVSQATASLEQALPAAAVLLGDAETEPAALGEVAVDLVG